jgi:hypothetical protein
MQNSLRCMLVIPLMALIALLTLASAGASLAAPQRLAMVVGNNLYESLPSLQKAGNDADAIAATLSGLGFAVDLRHDADRRSMTRGLSDLAGRIQPGDEVLFYYAGHGIEIQGRNYLLPADAPAARPGDESFLTAESVAVDDVLETLQSRGARITVLILDACRDNPFPRQGTRSAGGTRGLAPIAAPEGAFILFSAGTGQSALDRLGATDANPNSVFTRALLPLLATPDLALQDLAREVKAEVEKSAASVNHKQRPAYYDELTGDFVLAGKATPAPSPVVVAAPTPAPVAAAAAAPLPPANPCEAAQSEWALVENAQDSTLLRGFADSHAACATYAAAARSRAATLDAARAAPPPQPDVKAKTWRVKKSVSDGYLNVRDGAGTNHPILFSLNAGTGGITLSQCRKPDPGAGRYDFCLVSVDGRSGWLSSNGIERE